MIIATGSRYRELGVSGEKKLSGHGVSWCATCDGFFFREQEIAVLIAQGLRDRDIAATLVLSPYTVQDHVRSLFEKTGVSSRQELVAQIFLDDYLPRMAAGAPLTAGGTFGSRRAATG